MKTTKGWFLVLPVAFLFVASVLPVQSQQQQSGTQSQADSGASSQPNQKKKPDASASVSNPASSAAPVGNSSPATPASPAAAKATTAQQAPPARAAGMVWVNIDSGVYHKPGTRWYGKTKHGKYMTEADAIKAGYKASGKN